MNDVNHDPDQQHPAEPNGAQSPQEKGRRGRTRAEERIAAIDTSPTALVGQIAELKARAESAEAETESIRGSWQRTAADFANYKRRTEEDRFRELGQASEALIRKVLGVADDLSRALEHVPPEEQESPWVEGVAAIERKLAGVLSSEGVSPIEAVGKPFDPRVHDAVTLEPTNDVAEGIVTRELQRGYELRDRVLRPALVVVSKAADA